MNLDHTNIVLKSAIKSHAKSLNICHINAQSILKKDKLDEFRAIINDVPFDAICVSETWLQPCRMDYEARIHGYTLVRNDRTSGTHGGVCIYVRNGLHFTVISRSVSSHTEYLLIEFLFGDSKMLLGTFYRPPDVHGILEIEYALSALHPLYDDIVLIGDFNINVLKLASLSNKFKDFLETIGLCVVNVEPTHFSGTSSSQIDLIITNKPQKMNRVNQVSVPGISKHDLIFCCYEMCIGRQNNTLPTYYRSLKFINFTELFADVERMDWSLVYDLPNVDDQIEYLSGCLGSLCNKHAPLMKVRSRNKKYPAWFNSEVTIALHERDLAYKHWRVFRTVESKITYNKLRNNSNRICRDAKSAYFKKMFPPKLPQKCIWRNLSDLGVVERASPKINFDPDQINAFFTTGQSVFVGNTMSPPNQRHSNSSEELSFRGVSVSEVYDAILSIKSGAIGIDGICPKFVKLILPSIIHALTHTFNHIITTSNFPLAWKEAKVIPIPKKSKIEAIQDLRPISLLPFLSKVFEKLIQHQISKFLNLNKLLNPLQSGFRKYHSTSTALLKVHSDLLKHLDNGKAAILVLLDFSKAFDTVPHTLLLHKLSHNFNFSNNAVNLISSYLQQRSQSVYCNGSFSKSSTLIAGVPQGSILGPILFSMFINDLPLVLRTSEYHLYADDFQIYQATKPAQIDTCVGNINHDLKHIGDWSKLNGVQLNISKTQAMLVYRKGTNVVASSIVLSDIIIPYADKIKNLGLIFDKHLSWDSDVNRVVANCYGTLRPLWKFANYVPQNIRRDLIVSLILPHLIYGCAVRSKLLIYNEQKLEMIFNSCIRFIFGLRKFDRLSPYRTKVLGCTLEKYIEVQILVFLYKILNTKEPGYLYSKCELARSSRTLNLTLPKFHYNFYRRCFFVHAVKMWNSLHPDVKKSKTVDVFRQACESFLF